MDDLKEFSVDLSIGYIGVRAVALNDDEARKPEQTVKI